MRVDGLHCRTIAPTRAGAVEIIDQRFLPHRFARLELTTPEQAALSIAEMRVRGAPLIGVTAAYGVSLAMQRDPSDAELARACELLRRARPTAVNLSWAVDRLQRILRPTPEQRRAEVARAEADAMAEEDVRCCRAIGEHGAELLEAVARERRRAVRILTHCNAGWLATVDYGTALAPVYVARERGVEVEVVVEETRPRNQGLLTAWELAHEGVPHELIADNAGGHLMQRGEIDLCIVGTDRTTRTGDVANKIGTYLKALAAHDNGVPFWVALPRSSFDPSLEAGSAIAIEERSGDEVRRVSGLDARGELLEVRLTGPATRVRNPAFDVTPARLVTGFVTERGRVSAGGLLDLLGPESAAEARGGRS